MTTLANQFAERARAAGVDLELRSLPEGQHNFYLGAGHVPEITAAVAEMGAWLRSKIGLTLATAGPVTRDGERVPGRKRRRALPGNQGERRRQYPNDQCSDSRPAREPTAVPMLHLALSVWALDALIPETGCSTSRL
jgi:hypothetical protein